MIYLLDKFRSDEQAVFVSSMPTTTRVLCLHGYHGSAAILRRQIAPLAVTLPSQIELMFVDAPSLADGDFGWWHPGFRGWERTHDWAIELLSSEPVDALFGFSQGAALVGLLAAVAETGSASIRFDAAIMVGGFTSTQPQHAGLFARKLTVRSVHVAGRRDSIVPIGDSMLLAGRFTDPAVVVHEGGHVIPAVTAVTTAISDLLSLAAPGRATARVADA
jgi:predicted alpha/beta hydrolase family esterase